MFNCRMCTEDIASILGVQNNRRQASSRYGRLSIESYTPGRRRSRRPPAERKVFNPRKIDEVNAVVEYETKR
jgi:hypothetical protein